jgi:hypothetical protein
MLLLLIHRHLDCHHSAVPKCNAKTKSMYISERASKDVDFRDRENI